MVDLFSADVELVTGEIGSVTVVVPNGFGVVKFEEMAFPVIIDVNHREGAVGHLTFFAYRQGLNDGLDTVLHIGTAGGHCAEDLACQRRKDVGFHAATKSIGQHKRCPTVVDTHFNIVATEFLAIVVERGVAVVDAERYR